MLYKEKGGLGIQRIGLLHVAKLINPPGDARNKTLQQKRERNKENFKTRN